MKKIIIVINSLSTGGITTSLVNTIKQFNLIGFKVDLLSFSDIDKVELENVNRIKTTKILRIMNMSMQDAKKQGVLTYIVRATLAVLCKIIGANLLYGIVFKFTRSLKGYDIAISFSNNLSDKSLYFGANKFVLEKVGATKKITWLHVDYEKMNIDSKVTREEYSKFDKIVAVSEAAKETFLKYNKELDKKCVVIYNCLNHDEIYSLASEEINIEQNSIVCVGRLDKNKSQITLIDLAQDLKKRGICYKLYLIGDGPERENIQKRINAFGLEDEVELVGRLKNPYPYIKRAKLSISASLTESFGLAIAESLLLNTPTIAMEYPAARELINNNQNGIIVKSYQELLDWTIKIFQDDEFYFKLKQNTNLFITEDIVREQLINVFGD